MKPAFAAGWQDKQGRQPGNRHDGRQSGKKLGIVVPGCNTVGDAVYFFGILDSNELSQSGPIFSDDTAATLPSIKSARASVDDYFDGTHSVSMSMDGTLSQTDETTITGQRAQVASVRPT